MSSKGPIIYDPNLNNPYGLELQALLALEDIPSSLVLARHLPYDTENFAPLSGDAVRGPWAIENVLSRLLGPLITAAWCCMTARPLVVIWTKGPYDRIVFGLLTVLGVKVHAIFHNPIAGRRKGRTGLTASERLLFHRARCLVHSEALRRQASSLGVTAHVVVHPPYTRARGQFNRLKEDGLIDCASQGPARLGFIGALRKDKGADDLATLMDFLGTEATLVLCGGALTSTKVRGETRLQRSRPRTQYLHQRDLLNRLSTCDVVVAPYRDVTESGSLLMAASLGLPCLAYQSGAAERLLNPRSVVPANPISMARAVQSFMSEPWPCWRLSISDLTDAAADSWKRILGLI